MQHYQARELVAVETGKAVQCIAAHYLAVVAHRVASCHTAYLHYSGGIIPVQLQ